jgi:uncharacterized protein (DUF2147 family)
MKIWTFFATVLLTATIAFGAGPSNVLGLWKTEGGDSQLELFRCGEKVCGKIVWLKVPNYIDSSPLAMALSGPPCNGRVFVQMTCSFNLHYSVA